MNLESKAAVNLPAGQNYLAAGLPARTHSSGHLPQLINNPDEKTEGIVSKLPGVVLSMLELVESVQQLLHQRLGGDEHPVGGQEGFLEHEL